MHGFLSSSFIVLSRWHFAAAAEPPFLNGICRRLRGLLLIGGRTAVGPKVGEALANAVYLDPLEEQPGAHGVLGIAPGRDIIAAALGGVGRCRCCRCCCVVLSSAAGGHAATAWSRGLGRSGKTAFRRGRAATFGGRGGFGGLEQVEDCQGQEDDRQIDSHPAQRFTT